VLKDVNVTSQTVESDTQNADVTKTICRFEVKLTENFRFDAPSVSRLSAVAGQYNAANSPQQSPSWDANSSLASQEIRLKLWKLNVHFRAHNSPPLVHIIP